MAFNQEAGTVGLRKEIVDAVIKGFADRAYKFKQAVSISTTSANKNTFFRKQTTVLTGATGNLTKAIPRGANFPQAVVVLEKVSAFIEKYGLEDNIMWEDIRTNDINLQTRTLLDLAEGVVKSVDDEIWEVLTEGQSAVNIQSVSITAGFEWDGPSGAIIDNLMNAKQLIGTENYPTEGLMCFISQKDHRSIVNYLSEKGSQFPSVGEDMARNGKVGKIAGLNLVVSNSVTASFALVVVPKRVGTWQASFPLSTDVQTDPFKSVRIRVVEEGVTQLTDPKAAVLIDNTQQ